MSIFAGIVSLDKETPIGEFAKNALRSVLSRDPEDKVSEYSDASFFIAKIDFGAYAAAGEYVDAGGAISILAGDPVLDNTAPGSTRTDDLEVLHDSWLRSDWRALLMARETFAVAHYEPDGMRLTIATDRLGKRPVYYWCNSDVLIFATALRIMEECALVPKHLDLQGLGEIIRFGYPLANRTPYVGIHRLRPAEAFNITQDGSALFQYWRWKSPTQPVRSDDEFIQRTYNTFREGIRLRLRGDRTASAFLSGGLDSRCVVSILRDLDVSVHTYDFAPKDSQDAVFGALFADAAGCKHHAGDLALGYRPDFYALLAERLRAKQLNSDSSKKRSAIAWSGEGASFTVGFTHVDGEHIELMRAGHDDEAVRTYLNRFGHIPQHIVRAPYKEIMQNAANFGFLDEFKDKDRGDPGHTFYIFYLMNELSRFAGNFYEDIDLHKIECYFPFYDSFLVEMMVGLEIDSGLFHKFYHDWIKRFPRAVTSVPWQTYPGHEPCPLPEVAGALSQWEIHRASHKKRRQMHSRVANQILQGDMFPDQIISKQKLRAAKWLHQLGMGDYGYLFDIASTVQKYWAKAGGKLR